MQNKDTTRKIKQCKDCCNVQEIRDFLLQYFDLYDRYENRQFGKQNYFTLVHKDNKIHTDINIKLIWYNDEDLVTEVCLERYSGWRDEQKDYKKFEWSFKNYGSGDDKPVDWHLDECWYLWNSKGCRDIVENCNILTEISDFIIKNEPVLPISLLREKKLKQIL